MSQTIKIGEYLFTRLKEFGVQAIFGVPGDYNLVLLDYVEPSGLEWVGNCNELNAAYAADGYARVKGLSAVVTTFGVGELSAANGIAGAYAERAPVVHIVGTPSRALQEARTLMHHTFSDGEYRNFAAMHAHITAAQTNLTDPRTAAQQINWILEQALLHSRPVYLEVPDDIACTSIPIPAPASALPLSSWSDLHSTALNSILERVYAAQRPAILVDGDSRPCGILNEIDKLVQATQWPTWTTTSGKGLVNEQLDNVHGAYVGKYGPDKSKVYYESADLVIHLGPILSDTNTQAFTIIPKDDVTVSLTLNSIKVGKEIYRDVGARDVLQRLVETLDRTRLAKSEGHPKVTRTKEATDPNDLITQAQFYHFVNPMFRPGDIILTETGTATHGGRAFELPANVRMFAATTWLSIGYMLPATLGAGMAQREANPGAIANGAGPKKPRTILFIGDGSLQMSVQEISTMIKQKLNAIIFVINNDGYTIERAIHGRNQKYNDVALWRHGHALSFFGDNEKHAQRSSFIARTWGELESALGKVQDDDGLKIVEVFMDRTDCQFALQDLWDRQLAREAKSKA